MFNILQTKLNFSGLDFESQDLGIFLNGYCIYISWGVGVT